MANLELRWVMLGQIQGSAGLTQGSDGLTLGPKAHSELKGATLRLKRPPWGSKCQPWGSKCPPWGSKEPPWGPKDILVSIKSHLYQDHNVPVEIIVFSGYPHTRGECSLVTKRPDILSLSFFPSYLILTHTLREIMSTNQMRYINTAFMAKHWVINDLNDSDGIMM